MLHDPNDPGDTCVLRRPTRSSVYWRRIHGDGSPVQVWHERAEDRLQHVAAVEAQGSPAFDTWHEVLAWAAEPLEPDHLHYQGAAASS